MLNQVRLHPKIQTGMTEREKIIRNYIEGYNAFDLDKMVMDFDDHIVFENIQNGEVNLSLKGLDAFVQQAELAKTYFSERKQVIRSFHHSASATEVKIDYHATLAMDFPNGLKKGEGLTLKGRSVFEFDGSRITRLADIS